MSTFNNKALKGLLLLVLAASAAYSQSSIGSSAYAAIQDEGSNLTRRQTLNFTGSGVSCSDSGGVTVCNIAGGSGGITSLNALTASVQLFAIGTSGSDFAVVSSVDTHTFNLPTASASNRGALSSTDWSTFNNKESTLTFSSPLVRTVNTITCPTCATSTGITTLNTLTAATQTFAVGTAGSDFAISSVTSTHTFNLPTASASVRGALASADWSTFNNKATTVANTFTGQQILSLVGAASIPPLTLTGTWFSGGSATTTKPQVLIEPTGATTTAWNTSGTGFGVNSASGFGGNLVDFQSNGTSRFRVSNSAIVTVTGAGGVVILDGSSGPTVSSLLFRSPIAAATAGAGLSLGTTTARAPTSGTSSIVSVQGTVNPASGTGAISGLEISSTFNQTSTATGTTRGIGIVPTLTSTYDYRHLDIPSSTINILSTSPDQQAVFIGIQTYAAAGAKTITNASSLRVSGVPIAGTNVTITNGYALWVDDGLSKFDGIAKTDAYFQTAIYAVASLPTCNAGAEGAVAGVNNALAPAFLVAVVGGGTVHTPVYCDGTNWIAY